MQKNAWIVIGVFVCFLMVVGLCFFIRKKEQYLNSEEYLEDDGIVDADDAIEFVDNEDVRGFGSGPGLYGSGRHTSESYGGW